MVHSTAQLLASDESILRTPPCALSPEQAFLLRRTHRQSARTHALTDRKMYTHTSRCTRRLRLTYIFLWLPPPPSTFPPRFTLSAVRYHSGRLQVGIEGLSPRGRLTLQSFTFLVVNLVRRENKSQTWNESLHRRLCGGTGGRGRKRRSRVTLAKEGDVHR